jgi:hypothetical protein
MPCPNTRSSSGSSPGRDQTQDEAEQAPTDERQADSDRGARLVHLDVFDEGDPVTVCVDCQAMVGSRRVEVVSGVTGRQQALVVDVGEEALGIGDDYFGSSGSVRVDDGDGEVQCIAGVGARDDDDQHIVIGTGPGRDAITSLVQADPE